MRLHLLLGRWVQRKQGQPSHAEAGVGVVLHLAEARAARSLKYLINRSGRPHLRISLSWHEYPKRKTPLPPGTTKLKKCKGIRNNQAPSHQTSSFQTSVRERRSFWPAPRIEIGATHCPGSPCRRPGRQIIRATGLELG